MPSKTKVGLKAIGTQPLRGRRTWVAALLLTVMAVSAQMAAQQTPESLHFAAPVIAVTYDLERAKVANTSCGCFWLKGSSADLAVPFYRGLSIAGSFGGGHASSNQSGAGLSKISYLAGPRYTFNTSHLFRVTRGPQIFGQALFGGTHGFNGPFPIPGAIPSSANSYAMQFGGGLDLPFAGGFNLRAFDLDYVRTALPNNGTNTQNDLRVAFGVSYRFSKN
jgi:outer membrane immunogenic protein